MIPTFSSIKFSGTVRPKLTDLSIPGPDTFFAQLQVLNREMTELLA